MWEWGRRKGPLYALPSVTLLSSCLAGPPCPGAATPPAFSSPPRRTPRLRQISGTRWTPVASITSTRRSSKCFPRYIPYMVVWGEVGGQSLWQGPKSAQHALHSACGCFGMVHCTACLALCMPMLWSRPANGLQPSNPSSRLPEESCLGMTMPTSYGFYDLGSKQVKILPISLHNEDIPQLSRRGINCTLIPHLSQAQEENTHKACGTRKQAQDTARPECQSHQLTSVS